jgi:ABC-type lipoprotein release transport system permease subunit
MNGGGPGRIVGMIAKSFTLIGLPLLLTFGSSWYPSRRSSSSSKVTEVGATPMEE